MKRVAVLLAVVGLVATLLTASAATAAAPPVAPGASAVGAAAPVAARIPYAVRVSMVKDGPRRDLWASRFTHFCCTGVAKFSRSTHEVDMNVYKVHEKVPRWKYYILDISVKRTSGKGNGGGWKSFIAWTPRKVSETSYSEGMSAEDEGGCYTVSAGLTGGIGPISAGVSISRGVFCGRKPRLKFQHTKSTAGRGGHWTAYRPGSVKTLSMQKVIRVHRKRKPPPFRVRLGAPCDYQNHVGNLITDTCYKYFKLKYK